MFEKGKPKTGGRKPGVKNKTTAEIREKLQMVLSGMVEHFEEDLEEMNGFKRWQIASSVFKYIMPALSKSDDKVEHSGGYNITVSFEDNEAAPERDNTSENGEV
jgi:hypothetical protein